MNNLKNIIWVALGLMLSISACKKYEQFPVDKIILEDVFDKRDSSGKNAQAYLYTIYECAKNEHNLVDGNYLDAATDDAVASDPATDIELLATGGYDAFTFPPSADVWSSGRTYYQGIRRATEFVNNIEVVPVKETYNGYSQKFLWRSEARFLRAYFYFELVKRYGGVPLLYNKLYTIDDDLNIPRSSFEDCINFIVGECDAIKDTLLVAPLSGGNAHRITRGAALALKSRALLYAASPLYNGGNIAPNNPLTGYVGAADPNRWVLAANAAKDVLDISAYDTVNNKSIFLDNNNPELIYTRTADRGTAIESANGPLGYTTAGGRGATSPTQDLVASFPMSNGKDITEEGSGFNPETPYLNRDSRLNTTILYNDAVWLNGRLQTYEGGRSKPNGNSVQTRTSYYMRKFMGRFETTSGYDSHLSDWVVFRYTEMVLNYVEALNEAEGPSDEIYIYLAKLRKRAGIAPGSLARPYGLVRTSDKDVMREIIRKERRLELAFEGHRYFDIRRWKIAEEIMNKPTTGLSITNNGGVFTFLPINVTQPQFISPKMYFFPIPDAEVRKNSAIGKANQNPGW